MNNSVTICSRFLLLSISENHIICIWIAIINIWISFTLPEYSVKALGSLEFLVTISSRLNVNN